MRVQIDYDRCSGHGRCYVLAPGVFGCDDSGYGQVIADAALDPELVRQARLAEANCPEQAIVVTE